MKFKISIPQIGIIIVAAIGSVFVAHFDDFLPDRWQTYVAPDGTFSIDLPGESTLSTNQAPLEGGGNIIFHVISATPTRSRAYSCAYVDLENNSQRSTDQVLESARDGSLRKVQGTLLKQNQLTFQGFPGLQFQARARGNSLMDSRMVLVGKRLYMLVAIVTNEERNEAKTVQRTFDSLKLNTK